MIESSSSTGYYFFRNGKLLVTSHEVVYCRLSVREKNYYLPQLAGFSLGSYFATIFNCICKNAVVTFILQHEKFLQFHWLRAVVFKLNLKYLHVKITNLLRVVV